MKHLQEKLKRNTAVIFYGKENRRYLSSVDADDALMLITKNNAYYLTDSRYLEIIRKSATDITVPDPKSHLELITEIARNEGITEIFIDLKYIPCSQFLKLQEKLEEKGIALSSSDFADRFMEEARALKDESEIASIIKAQEITDKSFSYILNKIKAGKTEREIMLDLEFYARSLGSEGVAFDFIVVSGENTSLPHGVPSDRKIKSGDFITMDFGAVVNGYRSDMTRTVAVGSITDEQKEVYETVLAAQNKALGMLKSGVTGAEADKTARDVIDSKGYGKYFGHALGHGVGLEIHESPNLSPKNDKPLKTGNVVTVEPGIYIEGKFGVRIEDMAVITQNGILNLTKSNKELIVL